MKRIAQTYLAIMAFWDWCLSDDGIPYTATTMLSFGIVFFSVSGAHTRPIFGHLTIDFFSWFAIITIGGAALIAAILAVMIGFAIGNKWLMSAAKSYVQN